MSDEKKPYDPNNQLPGAINSSQAYSGLISARSTYLVLGNDRITKMISANIIGFVAVWGSLNVNTNTWKQYLLALTISYLLAFINIYGGNLSYDKFYIAAEIRDKLVELEEKNGIQGGVKVYSDQAFGDEQLNFGVLDPINATGIISTTIVVAWFITTLIIGYFLCTEHDTLLFIEEHAGLILIINTIIIVYLIDRLNLSWRIYARIKTAQIGYLRAKKLRALRLYRKYIV